METKVRQRAERKAARAATVNEERSRAAKTRRNKLILNWSIVVAALLLATFLIFSFMKSRTSPYDGFAACLAEKGATMYGTDWCSHCQAQKRLFGSSFKNVLYVNCDVSQECTLKGVTGYPTWIFADGTKLEGEQALGKLAEQTGCLLS